MAATVAPLRYHVLDSLRGLAAIMVVLYHLPVYSRFASSPLILNSYLFVDFFFVLSGFIIAHNYLNKLASFASARDFIMLRIGRLYPLHIFLFLVFLAFQCMLFLFPNIEAIRGAPPFGAPDETVGTMLANILLAHGLGFFAFETWNKPSWSISTEFYTYIIFALVVLLARRLLYAIALALVLAMPLVLAQLANDLDITTDYGMLRCLYGFFMGVLVYRVAWSSWWQTLRIRSAPGWSLLELAALATTIAFVWHSNAFGLSFLAPFLFALPVLIFTEERGLFSSLLRMRPFLICGALSYSIYMTHYFIVARMVNVGQFIESFLNATAFTRLDPATLPPRHSPRMLGLEFWHGDVLYVIGVTMVLVTSALTYRFVEQPGRIWIRQLTTQSRGGTRAQALVQTR